MSIRVSIDASGGDFGFPVTINAGINALKAYDDLLVNFVGDQTGIEKELKKNALSLKFSSRIEITHASEVINMDDSPSVALRHKKDSSMRVAINLVKNGDADACVSAGNTGALMSIARFVLKTISGVDRPAIMSAVPIAVQNTENIGSPSVGLLNVGTEELKGNEKSQETSELLRKSTLNYIGFVEGDDIYKGNVDVIVCDGFEGNIALKASEGVAKMFSFFIKKSFTKNIFTKLVAIIARPVMKDFRSKVDPGKYNGASLLGLKGVVVKSHGNADIDSFFQAIREAYLEAHARITDKISEQLTRELEEHK